MESLIPTAPPASGQGPRPLASGTEVGTVESGAEVGTVESGAEVGTVESGAEVAAEGFDSQALTALRALVGRADAQFHDGQLEAIRSLVVDRERVLVVQRTGWGKSAVYFVATALLRAQGAGPTVILSPLLSLMRDQIAAGERAGIRAVSLNSANQLDWPQVQEALAADEVDVLLVSPERLTNPSFRAEQLPDLVARAGLLVVDEAHCVSDWGHDFRPDYRRIADLLTALPRDTPVLATTATANARVVEDVAAQLQVGSAGVGSAGVGAAGVGAAGVIAAGVGAAGVGAAGAGAAGVIAGKAGAGEVGAGDGGAGGVAAAGTRHTVRTLRGSLARASLRLGVAPSLTAEQRLGWLLDQLPTLPGSGIVYALTVAGAEDLASALAGAGHSVAAYTGRTDPAERERLETALRDNEVKALVATSALGMGFDKPDLGFVVHVGAPASPVAYYQQIGRAGRATASADVLLLPGAEDREIWTYFASASMPRPEQAEAVLRALVQSPRAMSTAAIESVVDIRRTRLDLLLKVLDVDGAVTRVPGGWVATGMPWRYDAERYERVAAARTREQQLMLEYESTTECRMAYLQRCLDDHTAQACGRCDTCTGRWFAESIRGDAMGQARMALSRVGVPIDPRLQWPTGMDRLGVPVKGRIAAAESIQPGRVLARFSDLGWGTRVREALREDAPVTTSLVQGSIDVLRGWDWAQRPAAVVAMPSRRHPQLVGSLAHALAQVGRLPFLGTLGYAGGGPFGEPGGNSAFRLAQVWDRIVVPAEVATQVAALDGPVLLVDDLVSSRWTLTIAGRALRLAGAPAVLPFALALEG